MFLFGVYVVDNIINASINTSKSKKIKIITIIASEKNIFTDEKNILDFLENKFLENGKKFKEYNKPVTIIFDYLGSINKIYMKYLSLKPNDKILRGSGYMEAYIFVKRRRTAITKEILEIYGHTKNFYSHVKGCYNNFLFMTLKEYIGKYVYIMNEYGEKFKYYITLGSKNIKAIRLK